MKFESGIILVDVINMKKIYIFYIKRLKILFYIIFYLNNNKK
jgi:hypothetical protein